MGETPLFTKTFDFLTWLMPVAERFPRSQRFSTTRRLMDAAFDFQERIVEANNLWGRGRAERLVAADMALDKIRLYIRLSWKWGWMTEGQHRHAAGMIAEMGRLLGGWRKQTGEKF